MKLSFAVASLQSFFYFKPATSQQTFTCPGSNGASTSFSGTNSISVNVVPSDTLCTLTLKTVVSNKETVIPVARSYDNNDWEPVAGPYSVAFSCWPWTLVLSVPVQLEPFWMLILVNYRPSQIHATSVSVKYNLIFRWCWMKLKFVLCM